jgi:hypothetical protein
MRIPTIISGVLLAATLTGAAFAQVPAGIDQPGSTAPVVTRLPDTTGGDRDVVISRGPTGADTVQSDSAAAGNAEQLTRRIPQGGGGGGR